MKKILLVLYLLLPVSVCAQDNLQNDSGFVNIYSYVSPYNYRNNYKRQNKHYHNPYLRHRNGVITGYSPSVRSNYYAPNNAFSSYSYNNGLTTRISRFFTQKFGNNYNYSNPGFNNYYNGSYGVNPQNMTNIFDNDSGLGQYDEDFYMNNSAKTGVSVKIID